MGPGAEAAAVKASGLFELIEIQIDHCAGW